MHHVETSSRSTSLHILADLWCSLRLDKSLRQNGREPGGRAKWRRWTEAWSRSCFWYGFEKYDIETLTFSFKKVTLLARTYLLW